MSCRSTSKGTWQHSIATTRRDMPSRCSTRCSGQRTKMFWAWKKKRVALQRNGYLLQNKLHITAMFNYSQLLGWYNVCRLLSFRVAKEIHVIVFFMLRFFTSFQFSCFYQVKVETLHTILPIRSIQRVLKSFCSYCIHIELFHFYQRLCELYTFIPFQTHSSCALRIIQRGEDSLKILMKT